MLNNSLSAYQAYTLSSLREIPQLSSLPESVLFGMEVVANVLPFKADNYVIDQLIDWSNPFNDPIFALTFPQKEMLRDEHFNEMADLLRKNPDRKTIKETADKIRMQLNPHPAGQSEHNVPALSSGEKLHGIQHKYRDTILFFPSSGQTCHAYCTFCFRWPQFVGMNELKFAAKEADTLHLYLREHPEITDVLFTGGDPMVMKPAVFEQYINPLLKNRPGSVKNIRIGSKSLSYWPYKFIGEEGDQILRTFEKIVSAGYHLSFMAHFNHPNELNTAVLEQAVSRIRSSGVEIRTQSPLLRHINADPAVWSEMWTRQVSLGCIPYYMFVVRDTGAQHYFGVPLVEAQEIFRAAYSNVSGLARTVRGPSMSALPGKVQILGTTDAGDETFMVLQFLRGRNPDWVRRPFLARYDPDAIWLDELKPAFGEKFFFEDELNQMLSGDSGQNADTDGGENGPP